MTETIGSYRSCEYCGFWFRIFEVTCPCCGRINRSIDASRILTQKKTGKSGQTDVSGWTPDFYLPPKKGCSSCIHDDPYLAKDCLNCPFADDDEWAFDVPSIVPGAERPSGKRHPWRILAIPAAIGCMILGGSLLAEPLKESANAMYQEEMALREQADEAEKELWKEYNRRQAAEGRDAAIAWVTGLAGEEATKKPAEKILSWCRRHGKESFAFKTPYENDKVGIQVDGVTALSGETYRVYMETGDPFFHGSNIFFVKYLLSDNATFEASLLIPEDAEWIPEDSDVWEKVRVIFEGDGGRVLAVYDNFYKGMPPRSVCIPLEGEGSLKIIFENCAANGGILGWELMRLVMIGDPFLTPAHTDIDE